MKIQFFSNVAGTALLVGAIVAGSLIGHVSPATGESLSSGIDPLILALVSLLFFEIRFSAIRKARENLRFLAVAWSANFLIIPVIGFAIAWLVLRDQPPFFLGLLIYFMAPCTDWFLGFTRMARGNTALGAALIPVNLLSQLLLYPIYLGLFARTATGTAVGSLFDTLLHWFLIPLAAASVAHLLLRRLLPTRGFEALLSLVGKAIPLVIAALVLAIFAAHIGTILEHHRTFLLILAAVFVFFLLTYFLGETLSKVFHFAHPEHALLTMTTAARNAPLMLGVTMAAFPDQPLIYAAIIIGMLVEFPHLTALKHLLLRKEPSQREGHAKPLEATESLA